MTKLRVPLLLLALALAAAFDVAAQAVPATLQPGQATIALPAATATGPGTPYYLNGMNQPGYALMNPVSGRLPSAQLPKSFTWSTITTGSPTSVSVNLEGAIDLATFTDGKVAASSTTFTSASAPFKAADVGKTISIAGAGAAGVVLNTTISAVTDSKTVTLGGAATTAVTAATYTVGRWYTLDTSTSTSGEIRYVNATKPVLALRANLATFSGGTTPTLTVTLVPFN